jgi:hypothetical protein
VTTPDRLYVSNPSGRPLPKHDALIDAFQRMRKPIDAPSTAAPGEPAPAAKP